MRLSRAANPLRRLRFSRASALTPVLCDYSLEEQHTGFEVIAAARRHDPAIPAALLTGYATKETADEAAAKNIAIMIKPTVTEEFLATTSKMLKRDGYGR